MVRNVRIAVPAEIAEELVADGIAVHSFGMRGGAIGEAISIAVETINTGSALVSIGLAAIACRRLAAATVRRRHDTEPNELTISITVAEEVQILHLDRTAPDAENVAFDFFVSALNVD
jgi:hypothetical protein